ncbi:MAG: alpha-ketoglutarate-dependent dioxygenase AlkB [Chitinophagaceae bacterium]
MNTLFSIEPGFPEGLKYFPDFLSEDEEMELCKEIKKIQLHEFNFQGFTAKRKVASFGYDYNFDKRSLSKGKDIPPIFGPLIEKVSKHLSIKSDEFIELLVTEYPVASVINWHRDAPPFDLIAGISLMSDCIFRLRPQEKAKQNRGAIISFPVRRRSLYIMQGEARNEWQHSTSPVKETRYSITLRTLRG